jgi:Xaa-Pro dipeptidase
MTTLIKKARKLGLDNIVVSSPANISSLISIDECEGLLSLLIKDDKIRFLLYTDFRYEIMVRRLAPHVEIKNIARFKPLGKKIGYEGTISHGQFLKWQEKNKDAEFVDFTEAINFVRAIKSEAETLRVKAAEELTCSIWEEASQSFRPGMTERDMARIIKTLMNLKGDGEAFDTIVCIGKNAAECHHVPDETVWNGEEPILVDMGVKLNGVCSDLTRNILPKRQSRLYRTVYSTVLKANKEAIKAVRPGVSCKALHDLAHKIIADAGFGDAFQHSLGHGVGYEIHELPKVSKRSKDVLKEGMIFTIEPGIYLEGKLGVRIEDLVLVTQTGCEVLSRTAK